MEIVDSFASAAGIRRLCERRGKSARLSSLSPSLSPSLPPPLTL